MQSLSSKSSNTTSKKTLPANTRTQRGGLRTTNKHGYHVRIMEDEKDSINNSSNSLSIGGEDEDGQPVDKTVYETAGIIDRIDRLKARVEGELSKVLTLPYYLMCALSCNFIYYYYYFYLVFLLSHK